jgi:hypothetical protein
MSSTSGGKGVTSGVRNEQDGAQPFKSKPVGDPLGEKFELLLEHESENRKQHENHGDGKKGHYKNGAHAVTHRYRITVERSPG